jgi:chorismate mutase
MHARDANRLQELEATAAHLRQKLDKARRNIQAPAADVMDSLRKRTQDLEDVAARKEQQQLHYQREVCVCVCVCVVN